MKTSLKIRPTGTKAFALALFVGGAGLAATPALSQEDDFPGEFTADVTFISDYVFRGVSLTDEDPAIQGTLEWGHDSGFYVGAWASSITLDDGSLEVDGYAGFSSDLGDTGFTYDVGAVFYAYPGSESVSDYIEIYGSLGRDFGLAAATVGVAYVPSGQSAFDGNDAVYVWGETEVPIPSTPFSVGAHLGYEDFGGGSNKLDWSVGLYASYAGLDFGVAYMDTDLKGDTDANARVVFSIGKSF
ncbi:MAG: TorF family putative porin [Sphingomonadales bacterium]